MAGQGGALRTPVSVASRFAFKDGATQPELGRGGVGHLFRHVKAATRAPSLESAHAAGTRQVPAAPNRPIGRAVWSHGDAVLPVGGLWRSGDGRQASSLTPARRPTFPHSSCWTAGMGGTRRSGKRASGRHGDRRLPAPHLRGTASKTVV